MTEFYDSNPGPFDTIPGHYPPGAEYAALYADTSLEPGYHPQPNPGIRNVRYITRRGGDPAAVYAGLADYEQGNVVYEGGNLGAWAAGRNSRSFKARVYCNRSDVEKAYPQVRELPNVYWWIATLDNSPHWTPALIVASIRAITGISLDPGRIWGVQWGTNDLYDTSTLFGDW